jgi:gas vesicle protein
MKDTGKVLLAVMAGAAIGTAIAILFAPAKGEETRKEILDAADELANKFKDKLNETSDAINDLKERIFEGGSDSAYGNGNENLS